MTTTTTTMNSSTPYINGNVASGDTLIINDVYQSTGYIYNTANSYTPFVVAGDLILNINVTSAVIGFGNGSYSTAIVNNGASVSVTGIGSTAAYNYFRVYTSMVNNGTLNVSDELVYGGGSGSISGTGFINFKNVGVYNNDAYNYSQFYNVSNQTITLDNSVFAIASNGSLSNSSVDMAEGDNDLVIGVNAKSTNVTVTGFGAGDVLEVFDGYGSSVASFSYDTQTGVLTVYNKTSGANASASFTIGLGYDPAKFHTAPAPFPKSEGITYGDAAACFLADAMIATPEGERAVQDLRAGDAVWAYLDGRAVERRVRWVGRQRHRVRATRHDDLAGYPVRFLKDALADGVPHTDLLVTAEHCMCIDGQFIPARMLINHRSVFYDRSIRAYEYYHLETETHSVLAANGMLTESFLDTGHRGDFTALSAILAPCRLVRTWEMDAAVPLRTERVIVEPIFRQIDERARVAGLERRTAAMRVERESGLHLRTAQGRVIAAVRQAGASHIFHVPPGVSEISLVSRSGRPCDALGAFVDDRRELGVLVGRVTLFDSDETHVLDAHLEDGDLAGWHSLDAVPYRWTDGQAVIDLGDRSAAGFGVLAVEIIEAGPYVVEAVEALALSA